MSELLASILVLPLYGQVVVESEGATDLPIPATGDERCVASSESVLVATRGDRDGEVLIEVRQATGEEDLGSVVFDGELSFTTPRLVVGSSLADQLATVDLGAIGWIPIKIIVDPPESPARVMVVVP